MVRNEDDSELAKRFDIVSNLELPLDSDFVVTLISVTVLLWLYDSNDQKSSRAMVRFNCNVFFFLNRPM